MAKVNKHTRCGSNGKLISCPECKKQVVVYHFSWSASSCIGCKKMIDKQDYDIVEIPKLKNGYYQFTCNNKERFLKVPAKIKRYVLFNEVLTSKINAYLITSMEDFYKEFDVSNYKPLKTGV